MDFSGEIFSTIFACYCVFVTIVIFPMALLYMICQDNKRLHDQDFRQMFGVLYNGIELRNRWKISYYMIFFLRRVIFCMVVFWGDKGSLQIIMLQYLNMVLIHYKTHNRPHIQPLRDNIEVVNEFFVTLTTMQMILFTPFTDFEMHSDLGWVLIIFVICVICLNMVLVLYYAYRTIGLIYIKYHKRWIAY